MKTLLVFGAMLLVTACVPGLNEQVSTPNLDGTVAGFWRGLWHGCITPFTFLISLFSDGVNIYEVHNNGGWYDFGFMIGISSVFGGGVSGGHAARRGRRG